MAESRSKHEREKRIVSLRKAINKYRYDYHVLNKETISIEALDSLKHELKTLEDANPNLITPDSPTQRVEGRVAKGFKKVTHKTPMLSLEDVFSEEEFADWEKRISKLLNTSNLPAGGPELFAELKFDGLAVSLVYKNGVLDHASTRGNGKIGEDVTQNIKTIEAIPLRLEREIKGEIEIRGEVIITKKDFEKINREQKKIGEKIYANPRNLAAGSLRQLDSKMTAARRLDFHAYDIVGEFEQKTHSKEHEMLREIGFKTDREAHISKSAGDIFKFKEKIKKSREKLEYEIDGLVIQVNDNATFERLGVAGKAPRGAVAFKFSAKEATTKVKDILVQVGRTGKLTPVAVLEPVKIAGVTVSRASLHNEEEIKRLGLKIGDTVIVGRAGDVIPDVRKVLKELRGGHEKEFHMPRLCPACGHKVLKGMRKGLPAEALAQAGPLAFCKNKKCPATHREGIYHFVSKGAFDIDGLGPKIIDVLLDQGLIQDAADLFDLKEGDIKPLERFGEKSASNLVEAIGEKTKMTLPRFLIALGILHVGEETASDLADNFGSLGNIQKASLEKINDIANIGDVVARSVYDWFREDYNRRYLEKLLRRVTIEKYHQPTGKLKGKTFVLTGSLETLSRDEAKSRIRKLGGKTSESVSKEVDYVVAGIEPGSKLNRAEKLGIKIINEREFLKML